MPVLENEQNPSTDGPNSPGAPGILSYFKQGQARSTGVQMTTEGDITAAGTITGATFAPTTIDLTGAATTTDVVTVDVTGDSVARLVVNAGGTLEWGSGSGAVDTNLYRSSADLLRTDDDFRARSLTVDGTVRSAFLKTTSTTEHVATIYQAGTSGTDVAAALNVVSDNPASSAMYLSGIETARGTLKVTHRNGSGSASGDSSAAGLSIDLTQNSAGGTAAQGIFITSTDGGTTGRLMRLRNGGSDLFTVTSVGTVYTAAGAFGQTLPVNQGVAAWSYDPSAATNASLLTNGTVYLTKVHISEDVTATKLYWWISTAGATPTAGQNEVGIYSSAGTKLQSTNVDADISSTGLKTTTITSQALTAGSFYWIAMVFNASTAPTVARATGNTGTATAANLGLTAATFRYATNGTGATALASSITPASNTAGAFAGPWVAVGA